MSIAGSALHLQFIISGCSRISGYGCENISCRKDKMPPEYLDESNRDSAYLDGRGRLRGFRMKRLSRKKGGSLRGGWKYGSGFVDGVFPVMGPEAQELLKFMQKEKRRDEIWLALDSLSPTHSTWDDLINVCVQLRLNKQWAIIVTSSCENGYCTKAPSDQM